MTLEQISDAMRKIDFAMLSTRTQGGAIAGRPMSNNGDVAFEGDSYFFCYENARSVSDIEAERNVGLSFVGAPSLLGKPGIFISMEGEADLIRDKAAFAQHWASSLDRWFPQGVETPGIVLIHVRAQRLHYWDGENQGEIVV